MVTVTEPEVGPEWAKPTAIAAMFGFSRPGVYALARQGLIKVRKLRRPGSRRGQTLVEVASVRRLLEDGAEGGTTNANTN